VTRLSLVDDGTPFDVTRLDAAAPSHLVLFAVGGGGDPGRHAALLEALAESGCTVVAPHVERLASPAPTASHLIARVRRLRLALDSVASARPELPVAGVGHSLGATMLLALAGARGATLAREPIAVDPDDRLARLALLAPATAFFGAPGALDDLRGTIRVWAGTRDAITPPAHAELLKAARGEHVEVRMVDGAGHFSFMNAPPPQTAEPLADRDAFLASLAAEVRGFVMGER
jgi:alpha-beta hydrolase superfamily lysophospholipase